MAGMADVPTDHTLALLRRLDAKLDRLQAMVDDHTGRLQRLEQRYGRTDRGATRRRRALKRRPEPRADAARRDRAPACAGSRTPAFSPRPAVLFTADTPFRPRRCPRPVPPPVRVGGRDGRGAGRALERGRGARRHRLAPGRLRGAAEGRPRRMRCSTASPAPSTSSPATMTTPRARALPGWASVGRLRRARAGRPPARALPLSLARLERLGARCDQPARPQPRPADALAATGRRRRRRLGLPPGHAREILDRLRRPAPAAASGSSVNSSSGRRTPLSA